ncbi:zinc finger and BTB domain-containing protein 10 isoform X2 [Brienomyrus brachyistius]|uniref:zinc finger and BTB domain-containing protein 10 isoform X2 n=1 Tax=Brienomyrus brachyistius TaxID=42636 RepID=UPI0020B2CFED|nr:zinc finger and BTB domain-containing protein 10 isoform X2 [Brienomyrus brachyistius]
MSEERNRRSLAFRGGGLAVSGSGGTGANRREAQAWPNRHLNGSGPEQEEDGDLGAKGTSAVRLEGGGSVSDSTEPEAEEEEDLDAGDGEDEQVGGEDWLSSSAAEGGGWTGGNDYGGEDGATAAASGDDDGGEAENTAEEEGAKKPWVGMRPQTLLQKHSLFQASWLQEFPWLKFCRETGSMSCSWCRDVGASSDELVRGSRNYKRALLLRHHLSAEHGRNDPAKQEMERAGDLDGEEMEGYRNKPNENSYCYLLLQELNKQRKNGILCDVSIVVGGQVFRAHKNILVAGSRFFKTLYCLTKNESCDQTTTTHLDVAAVQGFSVILDFLYSGNLLLTSQNAIEVMSVASYLQMTEVVQSCRAFIKDALNISIKNEAPDSVVVDYNKRQTLTKDAKGSDGKPSNFWATSILSKLSIQASGHIKEEPHDEEMSAGEGFPLGRSGYTCDNSSESAENESLGTGPVFVWNDNATATPVKKEVKQQPGSARRKNQITRRFVYNIPPQPEEAYDYCMLVQPTASYPREDLLFLSENAGESSDVTENKLKCPHCSYIAKHRRTLKRHLIIHSGVRSFSCDICGKLFTRREHVKRHSLVHMKDKKYKCMVCKKIFMLAASVGIRHGSRRYGVCADCADSHQGSQEGLEAMQELEFSREDDFEETADGEEDLADEGEEPNEIDQSNWEEGDGSRAGAALDED